MASEGPADEERARIRREDREQHRHDGPEPELGDVAHEQETADPGSDPRDAEDGDPERRRRRLPHASEPVDDERQHERREQPPSIQSTPPS
jgi:hypothetical protein